MPPSAAPVFDRAAVATVADILRQRLGPRLQTGEDVRRQHSNTMSWIPSEPPDCVAFVESAEEVQEVVRICATHRVPIVPFGTGTSFEGHINAPLGGVSVDLSRMNRVLAVNPEDLDVVVEPGVTRKQLNAHIRDTGLMFPIDPGADASIGGMVSTRASGTNAVRYGTMRENVLALKVVTAAGEVMRTGGRARKSSAGYDLTRLMVGSEGTLGIITEVTLKLHGIPEEIAAGVCPFPDVRSACDATIATIQSALPIARIELVDAIQIRACNAYSKLSLPEVPHLFVEFHGTPEGVREQIDRFAAIVKDCGGGDFAWATAAEERSRLWQARHDAYWAALSLRPGAAPVPTDVCLPISRLADFVAETRADLDASGFVAPIVGHVGDGNFHVQVQVDMNDAEEVARCRAFVGRMNARAIEMGGTCTGEHGVGQGKAKYLLAEHGETALSAMRAIKSALDPFNIMNPGKIVPA